MPVAVRKRSWEDHVTNRSGLQYSYDDLDLVCCHGASGNQPWMGSGGSKPGQRIRCASMPECCHQLPTTGVLDHASVAGDDQESGCALILGSNKTSQGEESLNGCHDAAHGDPSAEWWHLRTRDTEDCGECTGCNTLDRGGHYGSTHSGGGEGGTASLVHCNSCDGEDQDVFARPRVPGHQQQCISICADNGPPLCGATAGEEAGKRPEPRETMQSRTDGSSRRPEPSQATLNQAASTKLDNQLDLSEPMKEHVITSHHCEATGALTAGEMDCGNLRENSDVVLNCIVVEEQHGSLAIEEEGDEGRSETRKSEATEGGLKDTATQNNTQEQRCSDKLMCDAHGWETSHQTVWKQPNGETSQTQEAESSQGETIAIQVADEAPSDMHVRLQCCDHNVSPEKLDVKILQVNQLTNSDLGAEQCVETKTHVKSLENSNEAAVFENISSVDQNVSSQGQQDVGFSKLDTIPEGAFSEATYINNSSGSSVAPARDGTSVQQCALRETRCSTAVNEDLSPKGHRGNQASVRHSGDSPASEVADGRSEHHRPEATHSQPGDMEASEMVVYGGVQLASPALDGTGPAVDQRDESTVKMRARKPENSRLDSMVLLLMKLDQLDQEIDNALSATSSMDSTPRLGRRQVKGSSAFHEKQKAEVEAKEACTWLRAAGFPQYAQVYEDGQFPIDISSVTRDHDFLDRDAIEALCRRLNTLNKCALMRLEISPQRKRSEDSDEDEPCAISGRWTFQRDSKRWSRMDELEVFSTLQASAQLEQRPPVAELTLREGHSSESVLTDLSEQPEVGSLNSSGSGCRGEGRSHDAPAPANQARASSVASVCSSSGTGGSVGCVNDDSLSDGPPPSPMETRGRFTFDGKPVDGGKSTRSRAKSFLKRMESLRLRSGSSSKRKKKTGPPGGGGRLEISGPVAKEGLDEDKLRRLNCVDISSLKQQNQQNRGMPAQTMTLNRNRSVSYSTQTSTGSTASSQSEASGGSAVSTPSPVTRARSHSIAAGGSGKRGGMYLEGFDPFSLLPQNSDSMATTTPPPPPTPPLPTPPPTPTPSQSKLGGERNRGNNHADGEEEEEEGVIFFYLPEGHKPGTFPMALQDRSIPPVLRGRQSQSRRQRRHGSSGSADSRLSFYDNVPCAEQGQEGGEELKLEEVLQHVNGLQRFVNAWSETMGGEDEEDEEEEEEEEEEEGDSDSALDSASPCPSSPLQNRLEEAENGSDQDSTGNPLGEGEEGMRERRDSGVGASLTRSNRPQKLRWPSFQSSHRPSLASAQLQIGCQSVLQMNLLQKLSLLHLTALLEKHTPTNKHGFSWVVPKFMKRIKARDYKDKNVFGVPLQVIVQRTGQPLPQGIQQAMRFLRNQCLDQVGLFRKSGVKSRIQALRQMNEACGADGGGISYEGQSAYDVADMLKQYFRDLPEPLLTSKLSETFLQIYQYVPKEQRLQAARAAVLLLPDENREALQTLLCLLSDVTASVAENQMTPTNLAVCLAPSVFHLNTLRRKESSSPRVMNRKQTLGKPDQRDLNENLAATHGLAHMIQECRKLFRIPEDMSHCRNSYMEQALLPQRLEELVGEGAGPAGYRAFVQDSMDALLKDAKDKFKGYDSCSTPEHVDLAYKKVHDGSPLRLWKVCVEVPAATEEVLARLLREQGRWDEDLLESRVVETLDERTEIYQYVRNSMAPHPTRDHLVLRTWATDLPKGACALVCTSVDHDGAAVVGVRANVLTSRYFIEPCGASKCRLTHISRTDCRGRFPEWYNKLYGHSCAAEAVRIRESFTVPLDK